MRQNYHANAGHCFPLLVSPDSDRTKYIRSVGHPLGIRKASEYKNHSFLIEPGESLILYTDGLIEALDFSQTPIGFDRFMKMASECRHCDPETFYHNLSTRHTSLTCVSEDDTTIIVLNYRKKKNV